MERVGPPGMGHHAEDVLGWTLAPLVKAQPTPLAPKERETSVF